MGEFKQFHKRQEEGTVLHNRFVMQGLKSNWVRSKEEDTGRLIRPQPGAVSAELVALRGEQDASEIESPSNKKVNKMKVNNSSSTNSTGVATNSTGVGSSSTEHDMGEILPEIAPLTNPVELDLGQSISNSNSTNSTDVDDDDDDADESDGGDDSLRPDDDGDGG